MHLLKRIQFALCLCSSANLVYILTGFGFRKTTIIDMNDWAIAASHGNNALTLAIVKIEFTRLWLHARFMKFLPTLYCVEPLNFGQVSARSRVQLLYCQVLVLEIFEDKDFKQVLKIVFIVRGKRHFYKLSESVNM